MFRLHKHLPTWPAIKRLIQNTSAVPRFATISQHRASGSFPTAAQPLAGQGYVSDWASLDWASWLVGLRTLRAGARRHGASISLAGSGWAAKGAPSVADLPGAKRSALFGTDVETRSCRDGCRRNASAKSICTLCFHINREQSPKKTRGDGPEERMTSCNREALAPRIAPAPRAARCNTHQNHRKKLV